MTIRSRLADMAAYSDDQLNPPGVSRVVITGIDISFGDLFMLGFKLLVVGIPFGLALGFMGMVVRAM